MFLRQGSILGLMPLVYRVWDARGRFTLTAEDLTVLLGGNTARPRVEGARATSQLKASRLVELSSLRGRPQVTTIAGSRYSGSGGGAGGRRNGSPSLSGGRSNLQNAWKCSGLTLILRLIRLCVVMENDHIDWCYEWMRVYTFWPECEAIYHWKVGTGTMGVISLSQWFDIQTRGTAIWARISQHSGVCGDREYLLTAQRCLCK